ncbi:MAG: thioredoxin family protein [Alphaproteobacteria bacterium]|nr:thioredoxin family protein [Alphaproteobacteria bacterium]
MAGKRRHEDLRVPEISPHPRACKACGVRWWGAAAALMLLAAAAFAAPVRAATASSPWFETDQGEVRLIAARPALAGQETQTLGLEFRLAPHWHIYWRSPGDAGYPPRLDWTGSTNLARASVAWPAPQRFSVSGLETMGYTDTVVLPITVHVADPAKPLDLALHLDYLTCSDICIPYQTVLRLAVPAGAPPPDATGYAALIDQFAAQVPGDGGAVGLKLEGAAIDDGVRPALLLRVAASPPLVSPDAFVEGAPDVAFAAPRLAPDATLGNSLLRLPVDGGEKALVTLVGRPLVVTLTDGSRAMTGTVVPTLASPPAIDWARLLPMLALALAGGLILNFMPCVLPVLALKVIGTVGHAARGRGAVRVGFLASAAGIVASFLTLAAIAIGFRAAGLAVGWGLQFQQPLFLVAMAAILVLFAASLWGLYEIPLPAAFTAMGEGRAHLGSFFSGVLATLLATPCTAPLVGTALGFALLSPPVEALAIFAAMGVGLALPYLAVAAMPAIALWLPRPGAWMVELKRILGLALAASAVWLVWVLAAESGTAIAVACGALLTAVVLALAVVRPTALRRVAVAGLIAAALVAPGFAAPPPPPVSGGFWHPFDESRIAPLVAQGRTVFVDVTADWCLTCKVNASLALRPASVRRQLAAPGVVAMRADWTRPNPAIARYLRAFGRYGIPFNVVYGPRAPQGVVLPEILTPDAVLNGLARAEGASAPAASAAGAQGG